MGRSSGEGVQASLEVLEGPEPVNQTMTGRRD